MYDFLRGTVANLDASNRLSLDVGGVGYLLRISEQTRRAIALDGRPVTVSVRLVVREDDLILFGFADAAERAAFDLLTGVQQVGPAVAMAVLSAFSVAELRGIFERRDAKKLTSVKGVGAKTAERIVLEIGDKADRLPVPLTAQGTAVPAADEAQRALVVLGFNAKDAAAAIERVAQPGMSGEALLRAALGELRQ